MGVKPHLVMNILCFNTVELELDVAADILAGGADAIIEAGAILAGGQTNEDAIPKYGLCVTSFSPINKILTNAGAIPGDVVILSKAIGTAVVMGAMRADAAAEESINATVDQMCRLNKYAAEAVEGLVVHACTDVTGFGLLGHVMELANASKVTVEIDYSSVPMLPRAEAYAEDGYSPCPARGNLAYYKDFLHADGFEEYKLLLLAEPQTSGGLVFSLPAENVGEALERLRLHDPESAVIGRVTDRREFPIHVV